MLIGEVARRSGVSARMLRHYDALGLVRPTGRGAGGYREYAAQDIRRILHVESLRTLGLSLRQIGRVLDDPDFTPSALIGDLIRETEARLEREKELLERLHAVGSSEPSGWEEVLRIVELLRGLASPSATSRQRAALTSTAPPAPLLAEAVLAESDPNVAGALRWALARAGEKAAASLRPGLESPDPDIRGRAVRALAEIPGDEAATALARAIADPDPAVRRHAALSLGARGRPEAVPTLIAMVVEGSNDVEAAEALGTLARDPDRADLICAALVEEVSAPDRDQAARMRVVQALPELPAGIALEALRSLADDDPIVARTAAALAGAIEARGPEPPRRRPRRDRG